MFEMSVIEISRIGEAVHFLVTAGEKAPIKGYGYTSMCLGRFLTVFPN